MQEDRRSADLATRRQLVAWCIHNGADIYYRARLRQEEYNQRQAEIRAREQREHDTRQAEIAAKQALQAQLIADLGTRERLIAWFVASGTDPDFRRKQNEADLLAFEVRARRTRHQRLQAQLTLDSSSEGDTTVISTTIVRPPVPSPPVESKPPSPSIQASWIPGFYQWHVDTWQWTSGTWSTPPVPDAIWIPSVEINLSGTIVTRPGSWRTRKGKRVRIRRRQRD